MIFNLFRKETAEEKSALKLYDAIVAQARQPVFYQDYGVDDTTSGRFEMIVLHAYMLFYRLQKEDEAARAVGQLVFNRFFRDMDDALREIGIGDLSVPKKIKKMAQAFYGRVEAYDKARAESLDALSETLSRNIYPDDEAIRDEARTFARYVLANADHFEQIEVGALVTGEITFAPIPDAGEAQKAVN